MGSALTRLELVKEEGNRRNRERADKSSVARSIVKKRDFVKAPG
jgi:hypothetical protein